MKMNFGFLPSHRNMFLPCTPCTLIQLRFSNNGWWWPLSHLQWLLEDEMFQDKNPANSISWILRTIGVARLSNEAKIILDWLRNKTDINELSQSTFLKMQQTSNHRLLNIWVLLVMQNGQSIVRWAFLDREKQKMFWNFFKSVVEQILQLHLAREVFCNVA